MGRRRPFPAFAGFAVALLLLMGLPSMADSPDAESSLALDKAGPACSGDGEITIETAYQRLQETLASEPGYVDILVGPGGPHPPQRTDYTLTAVFDQARQDALPPLPSHVGSFPVEAVRKEFTPLPLHEGTGLAMEAVIPGPCPQEIRPGARMTSPAGCTFSFAFKGDDDRYYISTAGHCVDNTGQRVSAAGVGPFGTVAYMIDQGVGRDFAMILVDSDKEHLVNPAMCHWGGPTSTAIGAGIVVHHYGWGLGFGTLQETRARTGVLGIGGQTSASWTGTAAPGDSGSGAITSSGAALVTLTHIGAGGGLSTVFGTRITHGVSLAEDATGRVFTLQTAPLQDNDPVTTTAGSFSQPGMQDGFERRPVPVPVQPVNG